MVSAHYRRVCIKCRTVDIPCSHDKLLVGPKWRAPRKTNDTAWAKLAKGELLWDTRARLRAVLKAPGRYWDYKNRPGRKKGRHIVERVYRVDERNK